jgi:hypothetical protein
MHSAVVRSGVISAVVACSLLLHSCKSADQTDPTDVQSGDRSSAPHPSGDPLDFALTFASEEQLEALADGIVTHAEFERATLAMVQCMIDEGITFELMPVWDETKTRMDFHFIAGTTIEETFVTTAIRDDCNLRHRGAVGHVWRMQTAPSEASLIAARAALGDCLRDAGLEVSDAPSSSDLTALADDPAFWPCAQQIQVEFGIPGFAG